MRVRYKWNEDGCTTTLVPTLDEVVEQYRKWSNEGNKIVSDIHGSDKIVSDILRRDAMQFIKENYMEEALDKYPELMI